MDKIFTFIILLMKEKKNGSAFSPQRALYTRNLKKFFKTTFICMEAYHSSREFPGLRSIGMLFKLKLNAIILSMGEDVEKYFRRSPVYLEKFSWQQKHDILKFAKFTTKSNFTFYFFYFLRSFFFLGSKCFSTFKVRSFRGPYSRF